MNDVQLVLVTGGQSRARAGELDDEDEEEDDHVEEEEDLVMFGGTNQSDHRDEHEEDAGGRDASDDGKVGDDPGDLTVDSNSDNEERDHQVDDIEADQRVL